MSQEFTMPSHPPDSDGAATVHPPNRDPLLLDTEQIESLADAAVIRSALRHCNERRVTALDRSDAGLWAEVEDEESSEKLQLEIGLRSDGTLSGLCDCQTEDARDSDAERLCVHAVAALFAYAQGQGDAVRLADAAQMAREERIAKARSEVRVQPLSVAAIAPGEGSGVRVPSNPPHIFRRSTASTSGP